MIENTAVTCSFGTRPRARSADSPVNMFGAPAAIAPHFAALQTPERQAAVLLMRERGESDPVIAAATGLDLVSVAALAELRCRPLRAFVEADAPDGAGARHSGAGLYHRPVSVSAIDRAADEALLAIDRLRIAAGVGPGCEFEMTMDEVCELCGVGLWAARRRVKELESRKWLRRKIRAALPQLVMIGLAGRCRIEALATGDAGKRTAP